MIPFLRPSEQAPNPSGPRIKNEIGGGMLKAEDPYASMEKDQLISLIHSLVRREEERAQENHELKELIKELRNISKEDMKTRTGLMESVDNLTKMVCGLTKENKALQQEVERLIAGKGSL